MIDSAKTFPRAPRVMDAGDLAPLIAEYTAELAALDHTRLTVANYADPARHFAAWLRQADITLVDIDREAMEQFARHVCRCGGNRRCERLSRRYVRRTRRFIAFLVGRGFIAPLAMPVLNMVDPHVADYQQWLKRHRGIVGTMADDVAVYLRASRKDSVLKPCLPALLALPAAADEARAVDGDTKSPRAGKFSLERRAKTKNQGIPKGAII